jgi:hypothetical protein
LNRNTGDAFVDKLFELLRFRVGQYAFVVRIEIGLVDGKAVREENFCVKAGTGDSMAFEAFGGLTECVAEGQLILF